MATPLSPKNRISAFDNAILRLNAVDFEDLMREETAAVASGSESWFPIEKIQEALSSIRVQKGIREGDLHCGDGETAFHASDYLMRIDRIERGLQALAARAGTFSSRIG